MISCASSPLSCRRCRELRRPAQVAAEALRPDEEHVAAAPPGPAGPGYTVRATTVADSSTDRPGAASGAGRTASARRSNLLGQARRRRSARDRRISSSSIRPICSRSSGVGVAQRRVRVAQQLVVGGDLVQVEVVEAEQAGLLQVRHRDPPAAFQVEVDAVGDHAAQRAPRYSRWLNRSAGFCANESPAARSSAAATLWATSSWHSPRSPASRGRPVQRAADLGHLDEVVEVPGLQAGVLPVVDEGQQLARLVGQVRPGAQAPDDRWW